MATPSQNTAQKERKRKRLILIGAFIVFSTFFIRDEFRERLRDMKSAIDDAGNAQRVNREMGAILDGLRNISQQMELMKIGSANSDAFNTAEQIQVQMAKQRNHSDLVALDRVREALPRNDGIMAAMNNLDKENLQAEYLGQVLSVGLKIDKLREIIFDEADRKRKLYDVLYHLTVWLSSILFMGGWALALFSRLLGIEQFETS